MTKSKRTEIGGSPWLLVAALAVALPAGPQAAPKSALDPAAIGETAGATASVGADGVVRIGWSRIDVPVTVDRAPLDPAAGLGSWAAFLATEHGTMVMGDTVVFEDEITPALDAALVAGLDVTGLHNHFAFAEPPVFFMHIEGHGEPGKLASGVGSLWTAIRAVRSAHAQPSKGFGGELPVAGVLDLEALGSVLGREATRQGDVVEVTIPREGRVHGVAMGGSMGLSTWAAFAGSDTRASGGGRGIRNRVEGEPVPLADGARGRECERLAVPSPVAPADGPGPFGAG